MAIRTRPGNVLDRAAMRSAFEIDAIDPSHQEGWSVLVRGTLHHVDPESADFRGRFDPEPWMTADREAWLVIEPFAITGRQVHAGTHSGPSSRAPTCSPLSVRSWKRSSRPATGRNNVGQLVGATAWRTSAKSSGSPRRGLNCPSGEGNVARTGQHLLVRHSTEHHAGQRVLDQVLIDVGALGDLSKFLVVLLEPVTDVALFVARHAHLVAYAGVAEVQTCNSSVLARSTSS